MAEKNDKNDMYDFPVHDFNQEQNSSPFFHHLTMQMAVWSLPRKIVEIQNFCYHGNMTSLFSSSFSVHQFVTERIWIKHYSCPQKQTNQYHYS